MTRGFARLVGWAAIWWIGPAMTDHADNAQEAQQRPLGPNEAIRLLTLSEPHGNDARHGARGLAAMFAATRTPILIALAAVVSALLYSNGTRLPELRGGIRNPGHNASNVGSTHGSVEEADSSAALQHPDQEQVVRHIATAIVSTHVAVMSAFGQAPPEGHMLVADSIAQYSLVQGQMGWRYRYDRGNGTGAFDMAYQVPSYGWCATPSYGGAGNSLDQSYAFLGSEIGHTNTSSPCNTPAQGVLRPIRQWSPNISGPLKILIEVSVASTSVNGARFDLKIGDALAWTRTVTASTQGPVAALIDSPQSAVIQLVTDGLGNCHGDMFGTHIRVYAPDCDANGVVDATQISLSPGLDANGNARLDCCEGAYPCCPTDLFANRQTDGADLAILLSQWGPATNATICDFNLSGSVDGADLAALLAGWGPCPQ